MARQRTHSAKMKLDFGSASLRPGSLKPTTRFPRSPDTRTILLARPSIEGGLNQLHQSPAQDALPAFSNLHLPSKASYAVLTTIRLSPCSIYSLGCPLTANVTASLF